MLSFEREMKMCLESKEISYTDNCNSYKQLDFTLNKFFNNKNFCIDVKEKRQKINLSNWPSVTAEQEDRTIIIDDLAVRKIIAYAPYSGMVVRDNITATYYWLSVMDIALMPRQRVNRLIEKNILQHKGKWIINVRNISSKKTADEIIDNIKIYCNDLLNISTQYLECYGTYGNEIIPVEGAIRNPLHWEKDIKETR